MEPTLLTSLPLWVLNLTLASVVYCRAPRQLPHSAFVSAVLMVVGWSFCVQMLHLSLTPLAQLWWGRLSFTTASLLAGSFVVLCQTFPDRQRLQGNTIIQLFLTVGLVVTSLTFTPLILRDITIDPASTAHPSYGPGYLVFVAYFLLACGYGTYLLTQKWRAARGRQRLQLGYFLSGIALTLLGAITTNILLPAFTKRAAWGEYGPYFTLFFVGLTTHAIIRHRFFDIRVIVRQGMTSLLSFAVTIACLWGGILLLERLFATAPFWSLPTQAMVIGSVGIVVFHPVRLLMQRLLDRYVYRHVYDERLATRTSSQDLAGMLRMTPLCEYVSMFVLNTLHVDTTAVYLCHNNVLRQRAWRGIDDSMTSPAPRDVELAPPLMTYLVQQGTPIVRDELALVPRSPNNDLILQLCTAVQAAVLVPLAVEHTLVACIVVGPKLSGDPFYTQDIALLTTLGHQTSVALRRAQLYEEVAWMQEYNESILRQMQSGVLAVSALGTLTVMNAAAAQLLEVDLQAVIGQPIHQFLPKELAAPIIHTLEGRSTYANYEAIVPLAPGRYVPVVLSTSVLHGPSEDLPGALLVFTDLSQLKALEEEKRRVERLASIGTFAAGLAHEIRNPLVALKTLAELLPAQYDDQEFRETFAQVALREVDRLDMLVQRLRSLGGSSSIDWRPILVTEPLEETFVLLSGELSRRQVEIVRAYATSLPPVMGDHNQLKQVFLNLLLNSLEAMGDSGGTITSTIQVQTATTERPATVEIRITDTGPGIAPEYLPHIFEPFVTSKAEGTGLGLAICRGIIDYHRGTISAINHSPGPGATFIVQIPVMQGDHTHALSASRR